MDWASRHVLSWRLSNTMDSAFCIEALDAALRLGVPEIFNTDQGSQFTSVAFTARVLAAGARCSMDGRGPVPRQHLRRTPVAFAEVRGGLPARVGGRSGRRAPDRIVDRLLQRVAPSFGPGWPVARRGPPRHGGRRVSAGKAVDAGNAAGLAASSRCAAPPLRSGPSGDTASPAAQRLMTTGRVLPVVTDRLFHVGHPTVFQDRLTRRDPDGRFDSPRASNPSEYTLFRPSDCPKNQDHLTRRLNATQLLTSISLKESRVPRQPTDPLRILVSALSTTAPHADSLVRPMAVASVPVEAKPGYGKSSSTIDSSRSIALHFATKSTMTGLPSAR